MSQFTILLINQPNDQKDISKGDNVLLSVDWFFTILKTDTFIISKSGKYNKNVNNNKSCKFTLHTVKINVFII